MAKESKINVVKVKDLPLPPEKAQFEMFGANGDAIAVKESEKG